MEISAKFCEAFLKYIINIKNEAVFKIICLY